MQRKVGRRNKTYIESLEKRVADLEDELQQANAQLAVYKSKEHFYQTGDKSGHSELIKIQELLKEKGPEIVQKSSESHKNFISYLALKYGADGSDRRKVIKNAFRVIFDNIIPGIHKVFLYHIKRRKEISKEEFSVRMKKVLATKKAISEMSEEDKLFYEFLAKIDFTKEQKKVFNDQSEELCIIREKYYKLIRDLIKNRRDILELGKVLKQNVYTQVSMLTKEQMLAFIEYFKNVEHSDFLRFHSLWEIKPKKNNEENKEDVDLTASDDENYQDEAMIDDVSYLNIPIINNEKEEIKYNDRNCAEPKLSLHTNVLKSINPENQVSKFENFNYSHSGSPRLHKFEQDT